MLSHRPTPSKHLLSYVFERVSRLRNAERPFPRIFTVKKGQRFSRPRSGCHLPSRKPFLRCIKLSDDVCDRYSTLNEPKRQKVTTI